MTSQTAARPPAQTTAEDPELVDSGAAAARTAGLVLRVVADGAWSNARELLAALRQRLVALERGDEPGTAASCNVLRHALKVAREEYEQVCRERPEHPPHHIFTAKLSDMLTYEEPCELLRANLLDHLAEYEDELAAATEAVARQAGDIVCNDEVVVTMGPSVTVEQFLVAAKSKQPRVVVVESVPVAGSHRLAAALSKQGLSVTLVPEAACFAVAARADRVVVAAGAVLGLTSLRAAPGTHALLLAARYHAVPVAVLAQTYKLTPAHRNQARDTSGVRMTSAATDVTSPPCDIVPLRLVDVLVSQRGQVDPSYISQLHSELYHPDDYYVQ